MNRLLAIWLVILMLIAMASSMSAQAPRSTWVEAEQEVFSLPAGYQTPALLLQVPAQ